MSKLSDKILQMDMGDMPVLASHIFQLIEKNIHLFKDDRYLKVPQLAKELGINQRRIRTAIKQGHYGYVHPGYGKREQYYGTVSEATDYHFKGISKKKGPFGSGGCK